MDWELINKFADIGTARFKKHWLHEDIRQEVMYDLWRKLETEPDIDHPLLVWFAKMQATRHYNTMVGDPRSKEGKRKLQENTTSYDGDAVSQDHVASLGTTDTTTLPVAEQYGLEGELAFIANHLAAGTLKSEIAELLGTHRVRVTRACRKLAQLVA